MYRSCQTHVANVSPTSLSLSLSLCAACASERQKRELEVVVMVVVVMVVMVVVRAKPQCIPSCREGSVVAPLSPPRVSVGKLSSLYQ